MRIATLPSANATLARLLRLVTANPTLRSWAGNVTWIAFVLAQASDGALTYVGVRTFGPSIEANPLLAWFIASAGLGSAILSAKGFALVCGTLLHLQGMHLALAVLTTVYAGAAVWGWITILWPGIVH
jgi:hypothetical protein